MMALRSTFFLLLALLLPTAAHASCSALLTPDRDQIAAHQPSQIQQGLRSALADGSALLQDDTMGAYTLQALSRLCVLVPRGAEDDIASTFDLALEYKDIDGLVAPSSSWRNVLYSDQIRDKLADPASRVDEALALRLAATPLMTAKALGDPTARYSCRGARLAIADAPDAKTAVQGLYSRFSAVSPSAICQILPVSGEASDFVDAMDRLAGLETALSGALDDLSDPVFAKWLADGPKSYLLRLTGTPAAVIDLINEFRNRAKDTPETVPTNPCRLVIEERTTSYFSLSQEEIDSLEKSIDVKPLLEAFAEENPSLDSARSLWSKLEEVLAKDLDDCILPSIKDVVLGASDLGLNFKLDDKAAANLVIEPDLQDSVPVIEEFLQATAPTEERLITGIKAALMTQVMETADKEIEQAADVLAAAAEAVEPITDTAAVTADIPEDALPPTTGVTDATAQALEQSLTNPDFIDALLVEDFLPATKPELLKGQVRSILRPIAEEQSKQKVADALKKIAPTATSSWALTPELQQAILAIPYLADARADGTADDLAQRMKEVAGIQYPSNRLFETALKTIQPTDKGLVNKPLSDDMINKITSVALKTVDRPTAPRMTEGFAKPGCGCVPHPKKRPEIYSFYPFWFAPPIEATQPVASENADPEAEASPPPAPEQIDFSTIGRVAYYGLEFDFLDADVPEGDAPEADVPKGDRQLILRHEKQWAAARRNFVNEAHQHRAKVDVAFDLRNWTEWSPKNIEEAVAKVAVQMAPFKKLPSYKIKDIGRALPTIFDTAQPDGLTLIFHGYESNKTGRDEIQQMTTIIRSIYEALPNRHRLDINVGFDFELVADDLDKGLFDELYELLITQTIIVQEQARDNETGKPIPAYTLETKRDTLRMISRILLFLERKTSDSKKGLRFRMEQGLFQGAERAHVLESIVPVVPPSGHKFVQPSVKAKRSAEQRETFGQFEDDVIYFKANFAGIGFWPMPVIGGAETETVTEILRAQFDNDSLYSLLASAEPLRDRICTWSCPRRAYIAMVGMAVFAAMVLLTWRSFYSGRIEKLAFRYFVFGAVGFLNASLFAILLLLTSCDREAVVAPVLLYCFVGLILVIWAGVLINRARNGPMP